MNTDERASGENIVPLAEDPLEKLKTAVQIESLVQKESPVRYGTLPN